jgi:hypothetical protein
VIGVQVPDDWVPLEAADLPFTVAEHRPHMACQGFKVEAGSGSVEVTLNKTPAGTTRDVPCPTTTTQWLGRVRTVESFTGVTKIWLYMTEIFDD